MKATLRKFRIRLFRSNKALAIPVTYLILFVSTLLLISVTYIFAVQQINNQTYSFQTVTAKEDMATLDNDISSVMSQPGSAATLDFRDSGGQLNIEPTANNLTLTISDNQGLDATLFAGETGQIIYNLSSPAGADLGLYMDGDCASITNQSGASLCQLYLAATTSGPQIQLGYRPAVTYAAGGTENGQAVTDVRIYLVNLNSSQPFSLYGELPLTISCVSTQLTTESYSIPSGLSSFQINALLNGVAGSVSVPLSASSEGSLVNVELVCSIISIERGAV